jgi:hypothetical protein
MNFRIWNQKHISLAPDGEVRFNSVLFPHQPNADCANLASRFKLLIDSADGSVLQFQDPSGALWYAGINNTRQTIKIGPIKTASSGFLVKTLKGRIERSWYSD